jgi:hypothetical protein
MSTPYTRDKHRTAETRREVQAIAATADILR